MEVFNDIENVKNMNWCKYVLSTLMHCHESWTNSNRGKFSGSVLFLMVMFLIKLFKYIESCVHYTPF